MRRLPQDLKIHKGLAENWTVRHRLVAAPISSPSLLSVSVGNGFRWRAVSRPSPDTMSREKKPVVSYAEVEHSDCDASDSEAQYAKQQQARGYVPRRRKHDVEQALIARDGAWADAYVALYATADHAGAALEHVEPRPPPKAWDAWRRDHPREAPEERDRLWARSYAALHAAASANEGAAPVLVRLPPAAPWDEFQRAERDAEDDAPAPKKKKKRPKPTTKDGRAEAADGNDRRDAAVRADAQAPQGQRRRREDAERGEISSRYRGVKTSGSGRKWVASIQKGGPSTKTYLGTFDVEEDAARAYDARARFLGEHAWCNFPDDTAVDARAPGTIHGRLRSNGEPLEGGEV